MHTSWSLLLCTLIFHVTGAIRLWDNANQIKSTVPENCKNALSQEISCNNRLITASEAASGAVLAGELAEAYCTSECYDSIEEFIKNVKIGCGNAAYGLFPNSTFEEAPLDLANGLSWAYKLSCIKDCDGFCLADLYNGNKDDCSDCMLTYGSILISFEAGRERLEPLDFSARLKTCGADKDCYPWEYTPPAAPTATPPPSESDQNRDCSGCWYTVAVEDTCECISLDASVGTDNMIIRNSLDYQCHDLTPGMQLCLEDTCNLHQIVANETCDKIVAGKEFQLTQLVSWNPTIHSNCDNLDTMIGRYICISPPGAGNFTYQPTSLNLSPTLTSRMFSSWTIVPNTTTLPYNTTSWYYPILNPSPTPTPAPWNDTAASLWKNMTQYCWITDEDNANGFSEEDFPEDCQDLMDTYCFPTDLLSTIAPSPTVVPASCTPDRPSETSDIPTTTGSAPIITPTPTQDGMVSGCNRFYYVQSGDTCLGVSSRFGVSLNLFYTWNPAVGPDNDCNNLQRGTYACVGRELTE